MLLSAKPQQVNVIRRKQSQQSIETEMQHSTLGQLGCCPVPREQQLAAHPPRVVSVVRVTLLGGPEQQPEHAHDVAVDAKIDDVDEYATNVLTQKGKTLRHSEFPGDPSTQY
jgi:hypothetical protein